jgi:SAM-dependent methyltransferase
VKHPPKRDEFRATVSDSVSFDRAADYYDATRGGDPASARATIDLLERELGGRGVLLEIGVGTGFLALDLDARGLPVVGVDLSMPMLDKLVEKAGGKVPFPLAVGDATRLPFRSEGFGGAYARWVLHLIPQWRAAVAELCRVTRPGGVVVIEPGGYSGEWRELWLRFVDELGEDAVPPGLDMRGSTDALDVAFAEHGAERRELASIPFVPDDRTIGRFLERARARMFSWTWRISDDEMDRAIDAVGTWAVERFGDLETPIEARLLWRAYDLPA